MWEMKAPGNGLLNFYVAWIAYYKLGLKMHFKHLRHLPTVFFFFFFCEMSMTSCQELYCEFH